MIVVAVVAHGHVKVFLQISQKSLVQYTQLFTLMRK